MLCNRMKPCFNNMLAGKFQPTNGNVAGIDSCKAWQVTSCPTGQTLAPTPSSTRDGECNGCPARTYRNAAGDCVKQTVSQSQLITSLPLCQNGA